MAMISDEITINAAPTRIWEILSDHDSYVNWAGVSKMEVMTKNRGLGARRRSTIGRMVLEQVVDIFEPNTAFGYSVKNVGPFAKAGSHWTLHVDEQGTRVSLASHYKLRFGLPAFLFTWRVRGGQKTALEGLKRFAEN